MFGPVMMNKLADAVAPKLAEAGLAKDIVEQMPYSIWAIEELEAGLQIMRAKGITDLMEGKLKSSEMRQWDWHGYMINRYPNSFPARRLFEKEYDEMFSDLYRVQDADS